MSKIIFIYEKNKFEMVIENRNKINEKLKDYLFWINQKKEDIAFICKGKKLDIDNPNNFNILNNKKIIISVFLLKKNKDNKEFNYIICPSCQNLQTLNINDEKISMTNCINVYSFLQ